MTLLKHGHTLSPYTSKIRTNVPGWTCGGDDQPAHAPATAHIKLCTPGLAPATSRPEAFGQV